MKSLQSHNMLLIATVTRLKLFLHSRCLKPPIDQAPDQLTFSQHNSQLIIKNPTPYYLTLCGLQAGSNTLTNVTVSPFDQVTETISNAGISSISYRTINDFGGTTPQIIKTITR
ncbi:hypothetical protein [Xanthomonas cassavae]|nr:hypothetical protein [Xanthomonas cassavae]